MNRKAFIFMDKSKPLEVLIFVDGVGSSKLY